MSDAEMNEFCARELGWTYPSDEESEVAFVKDQGAELWMWRNPEGKLRPLPNFLTSESANAMLLEAMPRVRLDFHPARKMGAELKSVAHWVCIPDRDDQYTYESSPDRKIAIRDAFIRLRRKK